MPYLLRFQIKKLFNSGSLPHSIQIILFRVWFFLKEWISNYVIDFTCAPALVARVTALVSRMCESEAESVRLAAMQLKTTLQNKVFSLFRYSLSTQDCWKRRL